MTIPLTFSSRVTNGVIPDETRKAIAAAIRCLDGLDVTITVQERKRSLKQNAFYHGTFISALQRHLLESGHRLSHDSIHEGLRDAYAKNAYMIELPGGMTFRIPPSTARLGKSDFANFLEDVRMDFARRFGWSLPHVNEHLYQPEGIPDE